MPQELKESESQRTFWRPKQAYVMAVVCFLVGLPVGYLLRGSRPENSPAAIQAAAPEAPQSVPGMTNGTTHKIPSMEDMKHMAQKKVEPLLAKLKTDPNNAQLLNQVGIVYRSAHQFKEAQDYFQKSLQVDPKNADVRTDMAACMYYDGDVDGALAELQKSLSYDPKHAGALMNVGIIKWKAKNDVPGAVASWETLLKLNPSFPHKAEVQHMISEAEQSSKSKG